MDRRVMDFLERKMNGRDSRRGRTRDYESSDYDERGRDTARDGRGRSDRNDYDADMRYDGHYRREASRHRNDDDYDYGRDYGQHLKLTKSEIHRWKEMLENFDGTRGEHYDMQQIMSAAEKLGIRFRDYSEPEFCITVNMMYADYGGVIKKCVGQEKELMACAEMARAFLEDPDGPEPSEKLALYFHCVVNAGGV